MRPGLKRPARTPQPSLQLLNLRIAQGRLWELPPNVDRFLRGKKGCKRFVYSLDYFLLNFAYTSAYSIDYLPLTGRAGSSFLDQTRLILRLENIASPGAS